MPDWKKEIRARMERLDLAPEAREEIIAELASHIEDGETEVSHELHGSRNLSAVKWRRLALEICRAKRGETIMNTRIKTLWLPTLANLALTIGLVILFDHFNWQEPGIATPGHSGRAFRLPFLLILPLLGAVGSYLAKRSQASRCERVVAGLAPSLLWLGVLAIVGLPLALAPRQFSGITLNDFVLSAVGLVVLPALALALGALPFLRSTRPEVEPSRETHA